VKPSNEELQFSSSTAKLLHHRDRIVHPLYPFTLQLVPTDICNLNCDFCSVKFRGKNVLSFEKIQHVLASPVFSMLRGVEITGGGDPTLYPLINELIDSCYHRGFDVGLITNGVALMDKIRNENLEKLTWARISLNSLDYLPRIDLSGFPDNVTLGFSYVLNQRTTQEILDFVGGYADEYSAEYVRIVPDCLDLGVPHDFDLDYPMFYVQTKTSGSLKPIAPCRMGYLKPYLNSDGYFYWCSGVCLEKRYFPKEYRMGAWNEVEKIWSEPQAPFNCDFSKCFWVDHNYLLELANTPITHEAFL